MKIYYEMKSGALSCNGMTIPTTHQKYEKAMAEVVAGTAKIETHVLEVQVEDPEIAERVWRNKELANADVELFKVQDGEGTGLVGDWRKYRRDLRDWPDHASFPNKMLRPVFNSTDGGS